MIPEVSIARSTAPWIAVPLACALAVAAGGAAAARPALALGALGAALVVGLTIVRPVLSLLLLLVLTCVVPYGIQNSFGIGGGSAAPGLLLSDLLLAAGLARALWVLAEGRLPDRTRIYAILVLAVLGIAALQFLHGVRTGHDLSRAGQELRALGGLGTFLIVLAISADPRERRQLMSGLLGVALVLGAWGVVQWFGHVSFGAAGDVGVRSGVRLTANGTGQLQGGAYGFPVAIILGFAALISGELRSVATRALVLLAVGLNAIACLVTFERTFWISVGVGVALVVLRVSPDQRSRALAWGPVAVALAFAAFALASPQELTTASERLASLGGASQDDSVRYRVVESRAVVEQIRSAPVLGSGLAATVYWGQPWAQQPPRAYAFSHNGYLWLSWKLGIPAALLIVLLVASAVVLRAPPGDDPLMRAIRRGAQGALAAVLLVSITFPSFSALSITPAIGLLLGLAVAPAPGRGGARDATAARSGPPVRSAATAAA
jgi:hypothetical protein